MKAHKAPNKIRKSFSNKKQLRKYLQDVDSSLEHYTLEVTEKEKLEVTEKEKTITAIWYSQAAQKISELKGQIKKLTVDITANWYMTQVDSDSRSIAGFEATVNKRLDEVFQFTKAIAKSKSLVSLRSFTLLISHPLLVKHKQFDELAQVLNELNQLDQIVIDTVDNGKCDQDIYGVQKVNWLEKLRVRPVMLTHDLDLYDGVDYDQMYEDYCKGQEENEEDKQQKCE